MKKVTFIFLYFLSSYAFGQSLTALQYSVGFGTGDLGSYISKPSFRGVTLDFRKLIQPNVGIGFELGWNVFYEGQSGETYTRDKLSYSGNQYRYNNQFPMLFAGDYYLQPDQKINPFVGLGIGTMYSLRNTDMSVYTLEQDAWNFVLRPEAGVLIEATPEMSFMICGKYYHGFEAGDLPTQSYFALNFGFVFKK
jgi:hypothetical protein